jgi:hypothetical protein
MPVAKKNLPVLWITPFKPPDESLAILCVYFYLSIRSSELVSIAVLPVTAKREVCSIDGRRWSMIEFRADALGGSF